MRAFGRTQAFCAHVKKLWHAVRSLELTFKAKHHALSHMVEKLLKYGSPYVWGCWRDETANKALKGISRTAHRRVWHRRVLANHRAAFGIDSGARDVKRFKVGHTV